MLIEFSVENFRSVREEARLSLVAGTGNELYNTNVTEPLLPKGVKNIPLLRSAALYGPNAGGKSNLIKALATMQRIVMTSSQNLEDLPVTPFKFSEETSSAPSVFEVTILADGIRYQYGFSATSAAIHEEWLFAFPKGRTQTWFERSLKSDGEYEYSFGDKLTGDKDVWKRATRSNALFLSTAIQLNSQQLQPVFNWFSNKLRIAGVRGWSPHFSIEWCQDNRKSEVLNFLKAADFAISDVHVNEEDFSSDSLPSELPSHVRKFLEYEFQGKKKLRLTTFHKSDSGDLVELDLDEESDGTRKMFSFAGPWLDSLEKGHVLFIDELHDNLHPLLVKFLVQLFHNSESNPNQAQLVFSTHETSILSQDVFRRDQIWFCEREAEQNTRLYPLTEFSPRKGVDNLERAYLSGRYGALPFLRAITQNFGG
ncbi:MAG: ATP-binding protein [Paraglaciecola sp.]|nr:ATP-binding protein [Paraglaciecola sp.]